MSPDKCVPYRDWLAKYAAAFFKISRSSVTRLSSACSRLISISELELIAGFCYFFIQAYKLCVETPSAADTSATDRLRSVTWRTASTLNSSVKRIAAMMISITHDCEAMRCLEKQVRIIVVLKIPLIFLQPKLYKQQSQFFFINLICSVTVCM